MIELCFRDQRNDIYTLARVKKLTIIQLMPPLMSKKSPRRTKTKGENSCI